MPVVAFARHLQRPQREQSRRTDGLLQVLALGEARARSTSSIGISRPSSRAISMPFARIASSRSSCSRQNMSATTGPGKRVCSSFEVAAQPRRAEVHRASPAPAARRRDRARRRPTRASRARSGRTRQHDDGSTSISSVAASSGDTSAWLKASAAGWRRSSRARPRSQPRSGSRSPSDFAAIAMIAAVVACRMAVPNPRTTQSDRTRVRRDSADTRRSRPARSPCRPRSR